MDVFLLVYGAIIGACLGSWLTVVWYRLPARRSLIHPPSACPACGQYLRRRDNIPLVGYAINRGRCGQCQARISLRYPAFEAMCALLGALLTWWSWPVALGVAVAVVVIPLVASALTRA